LGTKVGETMKLVDYRCENCGHFVQDMPLFDQPCMCGKCGAEMLKIFPGVNFRVDKAKPPEENPHRKGKKYQAVNADEKLQKKVGR
jgi:hypothetical protein